MAEPSFLHRFKAAAEQAATAETRYRQEAVERIAQLEKERAFAYRRLNLLNVLAGAVARAESDAAAVEDGLAQLRERLDWSTIDESRSETLSRFTPIIAAVACAIRRLEVPSPVSIADALAEFETWYVEQRGNSFWMLFEQELPVLPLVEV